MNLSLVSTTPSFEAVLQLSLAILKNSALASAGVMGRTVGVGEALTLGDAEGAAVLAQPARLSNDKQARAAISADLDEDKMVNVNSPLDDSNLSPFERF